MKITIDEALGGKTVGDAARGALGMSRRMLTALKKDGRITVNGLTVTVRYVLRVGDELELRYEELEFSDNIVPVDISVDLIYEDEDIAVVNKPAGMPTHPSHGHYEDTLANALVYRYQKQGIPFVFRPVNRLDRNTSGIVLIAKNKYAAARLSDSLINKKVRKKYKALVEGYITGEGRIDAPIKRAEESIIFRCVADDGAEAITDYKVISSGDISLVDVETLTGRTHQIRVHFAHISHPLVGDDLYGKGSELIGRHALHASEIEFPHPKTGAPMHFISDLPDDMDSIVCSMCAKA